MAAGLRGKRVLVVEDEYFIASDLRRALQAEEAIVVGPVANLAGAIDLAGQPLDLGVLDVNLDGSTTYPVADRLFERDVPFMFLTGYDVWALPVRYRSVPRLGKPFTVRSVLDLAGQLIETGSVS